ncbi:hypothetical protein D1J36_007665 [Riemerella anatipestifer]|uniref:hypothetical protein n=1 Tax=Riemerella anatipestifer TaxID=34085 RepID=UPI0012AD3CDA|nr:hypothetical protein [Riemerella anatipestifer]USL95154.1 hypothetical protein D1J36_007665 [Riemerella anatipestifer]
MQFILKIILTTIIIFFVWNILKRLFFNKFYNYFPHQKAQNQSQQKSTSKKSNIKWEAETVDYEEIKE